ncbi:4-hydroxy-tetrahydrodipicolinate synthase [bacterium]|nr:4-hydroxy-tetrahydrodipicolinate synthase [bacterium]
MRNKAFMGTGVALITPFTATGEVDHKALEKLVQHQIDNGINYLVALGTTAETPTLSKEEKFAVLDTIFAANGGKLPVAIGAGGNSTAETIKWIEELEKYPHQGLLSVAPYYNKPSQNGMIAHFSAIAKSTERDIILYNVPGRTSSNIAAATTLKLANDFHNIVCIKEASGDLNQIMQIINEAPEGFYVVSGDDALTLPMIAAGAKGVISVIAQAYGYDFSNMVDAAMRSEFEKARNLHYKLLDVTQSIYLEGNPTGIKYVLSEMGICKNQLRLPLIAASTALEKIIAGKMASIK